MEKEQPAGLAPLCAVHTEKINQLIHDVEKIDRLTAQLEEDIEEQRQLINDVKAAVSTNKNTLEYIPEKLTGMLSTLGIQMQHLKSEITELKAQMVDTFVKREDFLVFAIEFKTIKRAIYGLLGIVAAAFIGGSISAIFHFFGF